MNNREDILAEINGISPSVAAIPIVNVFTVDATYFTILPKEILAKINVAYAVDSSKNLLVPDGYFESLPGNILKKIYALENDINAELKEISPILAGIESKETYSVPAGYFNGLTFLNKQKELAKVTSINKTRSFFKYAAAAVITGLLGLSIVNIVDKNDKPTDIKVTAETVTASTQPNTVLMNSSFDEALQNVSDNEIEQYLQKSGQDVNAALVASSTDDVDKLPEATDYLLDENVLENYLKENNLKK
jgi:hypothetical protein